MVPTKVAPDCPVCGASIEVAPRLCPRCDTPHHHDCWEYVPGCAVFACAEGTQLTVPTEGWPRAYERVLTRAAWATRTARVLQLVAVAVAVGLGTPTGSLPYHGAVWLLIFCVLAAPVSILALLGSTAALYISGDHLVLREAQAQGDRRLTRALSERCAELVPGGPLKAAWVTGVITTALVTLQRRGLSPADGSLLVQLISSGFAYLAVGTVLGLGFFYPLLKAASLLVGSQRILANRLAASLPALPEKG